MQRLPLIKLSSFNRVGVDGVYIIESVGQNVI